MMKTALALVLTVLCATAFAFDHRGFFWADAQDPLLEEATREDKSFAARYGRDIRDPEYDPYHALDLYERFIAERDLTDYQKADVRAHMGLVCMYGMEERDRDRARTYFREALDLAGDEILSRDLYMARTNYVALIEDPVEEFEALLDLFDWMMRMDEAAILEAVERRRPGQRAMLLHIDVDTGERRAVPLREAWPESNHEEPNDKTTRLIRMYMDSFVARRLPELCTQAALLHPEPLKSMQRLIERTEGTPIADRARERMDEAVMYQNIRDEGARLFPELTE